ncbi:LamG-like jellyroll fold domain-containing protein [Salibacter sp.]|uniref:LamG-like jellyroll fold domain-containing protein n=1 Tax=Salibacter sp. TaxID=2010995 RepID=UPI00286FBCEB|nr:LamG-like jellyroll fold domain-containing protein [Salibacter sp.]MDR9487767.1 LamG-like jellyroll fold domain-containing protein [Salibacter sp.]
MNKRLQQHHFAVLFTAALLFVFGQTTFSQTGPGGVSDSANLGLWLDASTLSLSDNASVTSWSDQSGNGNNAGQSSNSNKPTFNASSSLGGRPAVHFSGGTNNSTSDYLIVPDDDKLDGSSGLTFYAVVRPDNMGNPDVQAIYGKRPSQNSNTDWAYTWFFWNGNNLYLDLDNNNNRFATPNSYSSNTNYMLNMTFDGSLSQNQRAKIYTNGSLSKTSSESSTTIPNSNVDLYIGVMDDGYGKYFSGDMAELMIFTKALNQAERIIIDNYLGAKYQISIANDHFAYESDFGSGVIGIGRASDGSSHSASQGKGILKIENPSSLNNNDYLFIGHNDDELATVDTCDAPGLYGKRIKRAWKVGESNEVGTVDLTFDISSFSDFSSSGSDYALLVSSNASFKNATTITSGISLSGNELTISGVNLADGDVITLATNQSVSWDGSSWSNGSGSANAPSSADDSKKLVINGTSASLNNNASCECLQVLNGNDFTINSGQSLTVSSAIDNEGTVTVEHTGSLVQTNTGSDQNTGSGNFIIEKDGLSNNAYYNLWSSPIQSADILNTFSGVNPCDVFVFESNTQLYSHDYISGFSTTCAGNPVTFQSSQVISGGDGIMDVARGYYVPGASGGTRTFDGQVNNGSFSIGITQQSNPNSSNANWTDDNWNLVGNPYPSSIDANAFWTENAIDNSRISGAIYFWDDAQTGNFDDGDFAQWNTIGATSSPNNSVTPNGSIASGQGFWVVADANSSVQFTNSMRNAQNNQFFKTSSQSEPKLWLTVVDSAGLTNQLLIGFPQDATDGFDKVYDAYKAEGNTHIAFGSVLDTLGYAIQGLAPVVPGSEKVVDLYLRSERSGERTIRLDSALAMDDHTIYLLDRQTGAEVEISESAYTFTSNNRIDSKSRFALKFVRDEATGIENEKTDKEDQIKLFVHDNMIEASVRIGNAKINQLQVYDIAGREMLNVKSNSQYIQQPVSNLNTGIYVVRVQLDNGSDHKKKVVIQ